MICSVFEITSKFKDEWITELVFYYGDLSKIDVTLDSRFKEVNKKRKQATILGICDITFPIIYPLYINGRMINKGDYFTQQGKLHEVE